MACAFLAHVLTGDPLATSPEHALP